MGAIIMPRARTSALAGSIAQHGFAYRQTARFTAEKDTIIAGMRLLTEDAGLAATFAARASVPDPFDPEYKFDTGLWTRQDEHEEKYFFHCIPELDARVHDPPAALREFCEACTSLGDRAHQHAIRIARAFGGDMHEKVARGIVVTRVLRYHRHGIRRFMSKPVFDAKPHFDRDAFTVRWYESRPRTIMYDRDACPLPAACVPDGTATNAALIFPGQKFAAITRGTYGKIGVHAVIDADPDATTDRYAIVSFVHAACDEDDIAWWAKHKPSYESFEEDCRQRAA